MKKRNAKRASKAKAKRTGPSRRTAAERKAIDTRAATMSREAKRGRLATSKAERASTVACPSCRAQPGAPCFDQAGRWMTTPHVARIRASEKPNLKPLGQALAPLVAETAGNKGRKGTAAPAAQHASPGVPTIAIENIIIGKRHRKDFSHVPEIAASINERGGLISPISLRPDRTLIAGECRIKAWQQSRFAGQPIPFHVLDVDSIIAGEWDENSKRKDFTPAEAVAIKRDVEKEFARLQAERAKSDRAAPGRKASGVAAGRIADRAAKFAGKDRRTIEKAEKVVDAAAREPEKYGDLVDEMNRTGKVNAVSKKLKVREAKAAIEKAPPAMPMNAKQCATWVIDFPWAGEMERDQAALDAAGRSFRPYPEMSNKTVCQFARDAIAPHLPDDVAIWLLVTNFILVRGYHLHVYGALGFKPENAATMLTWGKDKIGRGQILRDQTEHAILLTRGRVTIDVTGANPPSTLLLAPRRENSRKPDEFWRMVERVTPAKRYASIFSQGGEGEAWDSHGDQVGKFAPAIARAAEADAIEEAKGVAPAADEVAPLEERGERQVLQVLETVEANPEYEVRAADQWLVSAGLIKCSPGGYRRKAKTKLTAKGKKRLAELDAKYKPREPAQVDLEEATAAKGAPAALDPAAIAAFENADLYRAPQDVVDAIGQLGGHVIAHTIDWDSGEKGYSVATCECGVTFRADRTLPYSGENVIAPQIEAHWRAQLGAADKPALFSAAQPAELGAVVPAIAASAEGDDQLEIPPFLRRNAENKVPA